jgi:hypothetical protein
VIASRAAREKLRTDVTEMSVLARHMLMAFKARTGRGAALADAGDLEGESGEHRSYPAHRRKDICLESLSNG